MNDSVQDCVFILEAQSILHCRVKMEVDVPTSVAYKCYSDREAIPQWMPFISSVEVMRPRLFILSFSTSFVVYMF